VKISQHLQSYGVLFCDSCNMLGLYPDHEAKFRKCHFTDAGELKKINISKI